MTSSETLILDEKLRRGKRAGERAFHLYESIKTRLFTAFIRRQFGCCGKGLSVVPPLRFANLHLVSLEDHVTINQHCWIHALSGKEQEEVSAKLMVGAHTSIGMGATISAAKRIVLGKQVLLARNVYISDHGHAFEDVRMPIILQGLRDVRDVLVGDGTWIGQNACVMPGVHIGKHCVIGANSVVTRSLPDYCVAVGSPARIVKQYDEKSQSWAKVVSEAQAAS